MDGILDFFNQRLGISPFNTALLVLIFVLIRQRYNGLLEDLGNAQTRIRRLERSLLVADINLLDLEE